MVAPAVVAGLIAPAAVLEVAIALVEAGLVVDASEAVASDGSEPHQRLANGPRESIPRGFFLCHDKMLDDYFFTVILSAILLYSSRETMCFSNSSCSLA